MPIRLCVWYYYLRGLHIHTLTWLHWFVILGMEFVIFVIWTHPFCRHLILYYESKNKCNLLIHTPTHRRNNHSLTHSPTHPSTHPSTHSSTHSLTHPLIHPLTHPLTHSPTRPLTHNQGTWALWTSTQRSTVSSMTTSMPMWTHIDTKKPLLYDLISYSR